MDSKENITSELERTLHLIKGRSLAIFKEKNFPISRDQWMILERIAEQEGSNQKDIAKDTFKDPAALTRMLDILVHKGFAKRQASKSDRRTFDVYLTVEGNRLVNRMRISLQELTKNISQTLTKDEQKNLTATLTKMQNNLH
ncbi:MAG: MarR family transcriptional regulator for hemolysin [Vicingaceae bacterium]|jgi:DNA-binding MarR family transcriptional regulator